MICEWEDCHVPWLTKSKDRERLWVLDSCIRKQFSIHTHSTYIECVECREADLGKKLKINCCSPFECNLTSNSVTARRHTLHSYYENTRTAECETEPDYIANWSRLLKYCILCKVDLLIKEPLTACGGA